VPRNPGALVRLGIYLCLGAELRGIAQQLSGEAATMILRELIVNENLIS